MAILQDYITWQRKEDMKKYVNKCQVSYTYLFYYSYKNSNVRGILEVRDDTEKRHRI